MLPQIPSIPHCLPFTYHFMVLIDKVHFGPLPSSLNYQFCWWSRVFFFFSGRIRNCHPKSAISRDGNHKGLHVYPWVKTLLVLGFGMSSIYAPVKTYVWRVNRYGLHFIYFLIKHNQYVDLTTHKYFNIHLSKSNFYGVLRYSHFILNSCLTW